MVDWWFSQKTGDFILFLSKSSYLKRKVVHLGKLKLKQLESGNMLYQDIPFLVSKLKQLELWNTKNNQLTGPIPSTLTQIPSL